MAEFETHNSGGMEEAHEVGNPRLTFFYLPLSIGLIVLAVGLVIQQVVRSDLAHEKGKIQSQRRILVPGPRGDVFDRNGKVLVGNRPRFSVVLYLDELRTEFYREYINIRTAYREADSENTPSSDQLKEIGRFSVVDRYLQRINHSLDRTTELSARDLRSHFNAQRILPFPLIDDLAAEEYARLLEQLPINSPLQVYSSSARRYPYGSAASHVLGYVSANRNIEIDEEFPVPIL